MDRHTLHTQSPPTLCVLASGSSGNCSVLRTAGATILIDAGLSPRRTRQSLEGLGIELGEVDAVLLTHLDSDHFHSGWAAARPPTVFVHRSHARQAYARGVARRACATFDDLAEIADDYCVFATLNAHDRLGTAAFRFEFTTGASMGFATDVGSVSDGLIEHLRGVDVLAVESNYCPRMQVDSDRPEFLKRRVMGGSGHLSNEQCAELVAEIGPRSHVVLLHLSRQCNEPSLAARLHARRGYRLTVTSQFELTPWVEIVRGAEPAPHKASRAGARPVVRGSLFDHMTGGAAGSGG